MTFMSGLTLLFIGLRLTNHLDWSWWLIMLPLVIQILYSIVTAYDQDEMLMALYKEGK